jgi:tetratricopeptide (TPR) repeat protein
MGRLGELLRRGMTAPLRALLPKQRWKRVLLWAVLGIAVLALASPALDLVLRLFGLAGSLLAPLLATMPGRVLLLLVAFTGAGALAVWLSRDRVRRLRADAVLGRHLHGLAALVGSDPDRARDAFRRVVRYRGPAPAEHPHVVADANVKLARLALDGGRVVEALGRLARVVEPGLPDELLRSLLQLRVRALRRQGELLPGALRAEVERAVARFRTDAVLLGEWRDLVQQDGDAAAYAAAQEKVHQHAPPATVAQERQRWIDALAAAGAAALAVGDADGARRFARKLAVADPNGPGSGLLLGDVHAAAGEHRQAVRAWGATRSPLGLDRVAELLARQPGALDPRELLECCPLQGTLLLVARELARAGDADRAERAARLAAESLGPTATVCAVLADVLELLGQDAKARLLREQAVARLLADPAPGTAAEGGGNARGGGAGGGT